jgi:hypothetical protein
METKLNMQKETFEIGEGRKLYNYTFTEDESVEEKEPAAGNLSKQTEE